MIFVLYMYARTLRSTLYRYDISLVHVWMYAPRSGCIIVQIHYHMTAQPHWPYMDIFFCIHDTCLVYVCASDPRSGCIIVHIHYHMTAQPHWPYMDIFCCIHDTFLVYVCASDPRSGCIVLYIHYHMTMQPYMDRVYVSPAAQRLDICASFPYMCAGLL